MDFTQIQEKIRELKQKYDRLSQESASTLRDKVQLAWCIKTLEALNNIVTNADVDETTKLKAIEDFLRDDWERIQGTFLSYTASANLDVAKLLIDIAEFIATEKDKKCLIIESDHVPTDLDKINFGECDSACIRVKGRDDVPISFRLMDSIPKLEELPEDFTGYVRCKKPGSAMPNQLYYIDRKTGISILLALRLTQLMRFDASVEEGPFSGIPLLIAKEALNHPKIPNELYFAHRQKREIFSLQARKEQLDRFDDSLRGDAPRVRPIQEIQGFCSEEIREKIVSVPLGRLMPSIQLTSYAERYPDLGTDTRTILGTHILDTTSRYLLPIAELAMLAEGQREQGLLNPYMDPQVQVPYYSIDSDQGRRLIEHSTVTRNLYAKIQAYNALAHDESNLLGQLNQLCDELNANSVAGRGREENAAGGAYPAIISFMGYYANLIPCGLQVMREAPTADKLGLSDGRTLGYVLVKPNEDSFEGAQLYFINTLDGDNPIKPICDAQTPLRFGLLLIKVDTIHEQVFSKEQPSVIFIKGINNEPDIYYLYGKPAGEDWKLTVLDAEAVSTLFPENCAARRELPLGNVPPEIYDEIAEKNAHAETLPQCLKNLHSDEDSASPIESCSFEQLMMLTAMTGHSYRKAPSSIPPQVQEEMNLLFDLVINPTRNTNATQNLATCIATRRTALMGAMNGNEPTLASISLIGARKEELVVKAREELATARRDLDAAIESPQTIDGGDALGITYALLHSFRIVISITETQDLNLFCTLQPGEIESILRENEPLRQDITRVLGYPVNDEVDAPEADNENALGNLVILCIDLTPERLRAFFSVMSKEIMKSLKTLDSFAELLVSLNPEKCRIICELMKAELSALETSASDFSRGFERLSPTQRPIFLEAMKEKLFDIIHSVSDFQCVLESLPEDQRTAFIAAMIEKLPVVIASGADFKRALELLSQDHRTAFIEAMRQTLPDIIESGGDFKDALELLSGDQRITLFEAMRQRLPNIIESASDFREALEFLPQGQRTVLFLVMRNELPGIISTGRDFNYALDFLLEDQRTFVFETLKERLPSMIRGVNYIAPVLQHLSSEQSYFIVSKIKDKLPSMFNSIQSLGLCLRDTTPETCRIILNAIKELLGSMIRTASNLNSILILVHKSEHCSIILDAMNDLLPIIIKSLDDVKAVVRGLLPENCAIMMGIMIDRLPMMITSVLEFRWALQVLSPEQRAFIFEEKRTMLPRMIESVFDFRSALEYLDKEQCAFIFEEKRTMLPRMIESARDFNMALEYLNEHQRSDLLNAMLDKLPGISYPQFIFNDVLQYIPESQLAVFLVAIQNSLPRIGLEDFIKASRALSPADLHNVMKAMEEQLSAQTPSVESFIREVIQDMSPDEKSRYFKEMAPVLARLIKKDGDVCDLERALNSETGKISELDAMKINLLRTLVSKAPINEDQIAFIISSDNKESLSLGIRKQNTDEMRASLAMLREGGKQLEPEPADQEMHDVQEPATPAS